MKKLLAVALVFGTAACVAPGPSYPPPSGGGGATFRSGGAKPGWVDRGQAGSRFAAQQYMIGVGHGAARSVCESHARAAIAKVFHARISQVMRDWQGHFSKVNGSGAGVKIEAMKVQQLTQVSTNYTLKGVEIKSVWKGPGAFHCLAALDRQSTAQTLRTRIMQLDAQIQASMQEGDRQRRNKTARYMNYKKAMLTLQARQALNADLRIVSPYRKGLPPVWGFARIVAKFTRAKSGIKIGFHIKGRERAKVQSCLGNALMKRGIKVMEGSSDVDLWIHGKIDMKRAGYNNGVQMVRATLNMRITGSDSGRTIGAFTHDVKTGRATLSQSIQLVASKLCYDVAPKLAAEIDKALSK